MRAALCVLALAALAPAAASAQDTAEPGTGAYLRGLDKITGTVTDIEIDNGGFARLGRLTIAMGECRYPAGDAVGDAYAFLSIAEADGTSVYQGWMVASSPALNPMDHPRYDVWVLRCKTAAGSDSSTTE